MGGQKCYGSAQVGRAREDTNHQINEVRRGKFL